MTFLRSLRGARQRARLYTSDSLCDGGPGAECADCIYGTDCADCGPRFPPPPPICAEMCNWASDADCDGGGPGSEFRPAPGRRHVDLGPIVTCSKVAVCVRPVHNQSKNKSSKGRATHHRNDRRAPTITGVEKPAVASVENMLIYMMMLT